MKESANSPEYIKIFIKTAIIFLTRTGEWTVPQASKEMSIIASRLGWETFLEGSGKSLKFGNESYIKLCRIGSTKRLANRQERISVALLLDRAVEHAMYEYEMKVEKAS